MERTDIIRDERILWLRFVLHPLLPKLEIQDWRALYQFAKEQAIAGICSPTEFDDLRLDHDVLMKWIGYVTMLRRRNETLNKQNVILTEKLKEIGFRCCILKGQGNAMMYPDPGLRTPGDIDVWVDADKDALLDCVKRMFPGEKDTFKHIKFPVFKNTSVDMHYTPLKFYHPIHNRRLQQWLEENKEGQMTNHVRLANTDKDIAIPTAAFNAVYQLGHIMIHIEDEGIGLRQFVDYFYVLKLLGGMDSSQKDAIRQTWKRLGLWKLAGVVMWIEQMLLGLPEEFLMAPPNEGLGRLLAEDILEGGNFGHHSGRQEYRKYGRYVKKCADAWHLIRLSVCFPGEAFFKVVCKVGTACRILAKKIKVKR